MAAKEIIDNFKEIITKKYFCFEGRAGRKEFWYWVLVTFVISIVFSIIPKVGPALNSLWSLAILLPALGVAVRRLHDTGKSGWMILLGCIPLVGLILIWFYIQEGTKEDNQYGPAAE